MSKFEFTYKLVTHPKSAPVFWPHELVGTTPNKFVHVAVTEDGEEEDEANSITCVSDAKCGALGKN